MIKLENYEVMGWEHAIRGMRNPMNSWEKSDSYFLDMEGEMFDICGNHAPFYGDDNGNGDQIGKNDHELMMKLRNAGTDHRKFMRMITVYVDITAPLYWWKEFDTYKVGTVANSCSTMHKIHEKEFTMEDFSTEHLDAEHANISTMDVKFTSLGVLHMTIKALNYYREYYLSMKDQKVPGADKEVKRLWWQMIQLLPSSYNQKRTIMLNYEVLANIYKSRKNHKLDEWVDFCTWIEILPYSEIITGANLADVPICNEIMNEAVKRVKEELLDETD